MTEYACCVKHDAYMSIVNCVEGKYERNTGICRGCWDFECGEGGPMDRPTHGDVSAKSWHASQCAETFFSPQSA